MAYGAIVPAVSRNGRDYYILCGSAIVDEAEVGPICGYGILYGLFHLSD